MTVVCLRHLKVLCDRLAPTRRRFSTNPTTKKLNSSKVEENLNYCAKIVEERDYENFFVALLMPKTAQPVLMSFLAVNAEIAVVRQKIRRNSGVAGIYQLQFWRDALRVWAKRQDGLFPRQPSLASLKAFGNADQDVDLLLNLVEARQATLGDRPFKTLKDLYANSQLIYGSILKLWANALLRSVDATRSSLEFSPEFNDTVNELAKSVGIAVLLRATLPLLREGVVLLPEDIMAAHKLTPDIIYNNKNPAALQKLAEDLCNISSNHLKLARETSSNISIDLRPALIATAFRADFLTTTLRANNFNLFAARLQNKHPFTSWKLWWKYRTKSY